MFSSSSLGENSLTRNFIGSINKQTCKESFARCFTCIWFLVYSLKSLVSNRTECRM